jgi:hypothetical protein
MVLLKTRNAQSGLLKLLLVLIFWFCFGFYLVVLPTVAQKGCDCSFYKYQLQSDEQKLVKSYIYLR